MWLFVVLTAPNRQLVAQHVQKIYQTGEVRVTALADLDLTVRRSEMAAVMGPSGSARRLCSTPFPAWTTSMGDGALVDGEDLFGMSDAARTTHRARAMGLIFQWFESDPPFRHVPRAAACRRRATCSMASPAALPRMRWRQPALCKPQGSD
jgi:predicted ABC-type transport system involved in lysophospholipase L1 biosynthesis ATPase subunit